MTKLFDRNTSCFIDSFIDTLIEGSETVTNFTVDQSLCTETLLERDLESRNLPPMEILTYNGNPSHLPAFIQCFKENFLKRL